MALMMTETETQDLSPDGAFLTALVERYCSMLVGEGIPLNAPISAAAILDDLFRLAEIAAPVTIRQEIER